MVGTLVSYDVTGSSDCLRGRKFLESCFVVASARSGDSLGDAVPEASKDEVAGGREVRVEVDRGDDRFERVGEDRLFRTTSGGVFTFAQQQMGSQPDFLGDFGEDACVDQTGADLRQLPFR